MSNKEFCMLWTDLETTGSDLETNRIIEIGCCLTDYKLNVLGSFSAVIGEPARVMLITDPVVIDMHTKNGLIADLKTGKGVTEYEAEEAIIQMMKSLGLRKHEIALAGSGVQHFDRPYIARDMPRLNSWLKYFTIDVGVMRRVLGIIGREDLTLDTKGKNHRAFDDAQLHLNEMEHIRDALAL